MYGTTNSSKNIVLYYRMIKSKSISLNDLVGVAQGCHNSSFTFEANVNSLTEPYAAIGLSTSHLLVVVVDMVVVGVVVVGVVVLNVVVTVVLCVVVLVVYSLQIPVSLSSINPISY